MACNCNSELFDIPVLANADWQCTFADLSTFDTHGFSSQYSTDVQIVGTDLQTGNCWQDASTLAVNFDTNDFAITQSSVTSYPYIVQQPGSATSPLQTSNHHISPNENATPFYQIYDWSKWLPNSDTNNFLIFGIGGGPIHNKTSLQNIYQTSLPNIQSNQATSNANVVDYTFTETVLSPPLWLTGDVNYTCAVQYAVLQSFVKTMTPVSFTDWGGTSFANWQSDAQAYFYPTSTPFKNALGATLSSADYTLSFKTADLKVEIVCAITGNVEHTFFNGTNLSCAVTANTAAWQPVSGLTTTSSSTFTPNSQKHGLYKIKLTVVSKVRSFNEEYYTGGVTKTIPFMLQSGLAVGSVKLLHAGTHTQDWGYDEGENATVTVAHASGESLAVSGITQVNPTCGNCNGSISGKIAFPSHTDDIVNPAGSHNICGTGYVLGSKLPKNGSVPHVIGYCHTHPNGTQTFSNFDCDDMSNATQIAFSHTNLCPGTHTFQYFDYAFGDMSQVYTYNLTTTVPTATISVVQQPTSEALCGTVTSCNGILTVSPTGGAAPFSYLWSNGATTQTITGLCPGTYTVTVTDDNGCTSTSSAAQLDPSFTGVGQQLAWEAFNCYINNLSVKAAKASDLGNLVYKQHLKDAYLLMAIRDAVVTNITDADGNLCNFMINDLCGFLQKNFAGCSKGICTEILDCTSTGQYANPFV